MLKTIKKIWHDPVWSKVISAAIMAVVVIIFPWWQRVTTLLEKTYVIFLQHSLMPNWLVGLMALCSLIVIMIVVVTVWSSFWPNSSVPNWKSEYREDLFFNIRWRWRYSTDNAVTGILSYCPECDLQIYSINAGGYRAIPTIVFVCECCNTKSREFDESYSKLENKIERFIHQKIRNKTWNLV